MRVCSSKQAEQSRAAPTLLAGLLQGESIEFTLNYNDSSENIIMVELSIQGPRRKSSQAYPGPPYVCQARMGTVLQ